ncbi:MAG: aminoglycoside phosphotransferase family protein [Leucothrix sp.]
MPTDLRLEQLTHWVHQTKPTASLAPASADASFRRYFRVTEEQQSWITMDAPPDKEALKPFIDVGERLVAASVNAPAIYQSDLAQGFLLMDDLGNRPYLSELTNDTADSLYADALSALVKIQGATTTGLPCYDEVLLNDELSLMPAWFLQQHLGIELSDSEVSSLDDLFAFLVKSALEQPQVFVHRDYHSRNLMITNENNPGVIDYQDAVLGPVAYDLVSLLRDCYIAWPEHKVVQWVNDFRLMAIEAGTLSASVSQPQLLRWFDLIGLQRHIKVLGIFARLSHRDGKASYLKDLPLTLSYVLAVAGRYDETKPLVSLFTKYDIPERIGTVELVA